MELRSWISSPCWKESPAIKSTKLVAEATVVELKLELETTMDALAEVLNDKLQQWKPETAAEVRSRVN